MSFLTDLEALPAKFDNFYAEVQTRLAALEAAAPKALATIDEIDAGIKLIAPLADTFVPQFAALLPLFDELDTMVHHYAAANNLVLPAHPDVTPATPAPTATPTATKT